MTGHPRSRVAGMVLLALAGLAVAVALSLAASTLATQPIGLAGETLRPDERLSPSVAPRPKRPKRAPAHTRKRTRSPGNGSATTTVPVLPPATTTPTATAPVGTVPTVTAPATKTRTGDDSSGGYERHERDDD